MNFGALIIGDEILSGKRVDAHFRKIASLLGERGLRLSWVQYLGDERARIAEAAPTARSSGDAAKLGAEDTVFLRDGERCWFVALGEISRIVVDGNYARLWFRGQNALLSRSLAALEARLEPGLFFRANRNTLVNLR